MVPTPQQRKQKKIQHVMQGDVTTIYHDYVFVFIGSAVASTTCCQETEVPGSASDRVRDCVVRCASCSDVEASACTAICTCESDQHEGLLHNYRDAGTAPAATPRTPAPLTNTRSIFRRSATECVSMSLMRVLSHFQNRM